MRALTAFVKRCLYRHRATFSQPAQKIIWQFSTATLGHESASQTRHPEDLHLIKRWGEALYNVEKTFEPYADYDPDQFKDRDVQALQDPNALMLVVEDWSRPVGYLYAYLQPLPTYLTLQGKMCVLEVVYLEEGARGKGLADVLILACVEWAKGKGAKRMVAGVYAENAASLRMFSRLEFEPHHITVMRLLSEG